MVIGSIRILYIYIWTSDHKSQIRLQFFMTMTTDTGAHTSYIYIYKYTLDSTNNRNVSLPRLQREDARIERQNENHKNLRGLH